MSPGGKASSRKGNRLEETNTGFLGHGGAVTGVRGVNEPKAGHQLILGNKPRGTSTVNSGAMYFEMDRLTARRISPYPIPSQKVCLIEDGRRVLSSSNDGTLRLWDLLSGTCVRILTGHNGWVLCCAATPDGARCGTRTSPVAVAHVPAHRLAPFIDLIATPRSVKITSTTS